MLNFADIQKRVLTNKLAKGFNTTNIPMEFALAHGELSEAFEAYLKKTGTVGEEIADVMIYLL
ncbi:MAG TPA: hypothetical protein PK765_07575 [bacterium]|nr:hypothetical protein [bacterium]